MPVISDCIKVKPLVYYFLYKKEYTEEETDKFMSQLSVHIDISRYKVEVFSDHFKTLDIRAERGLYPGVFEHSFSGEDLIVIIYNPFSEKEVQRVPLKIFKEYLKMNPKLSTSYYNMSNGFVESSLEENENFSYTPQTVSKTVQNNN